MKTIENRAILNGSVWAVLLGALVSGFALAAEDAKNEFRIENITPAGAQYSATLSGPKTTLVMDVSTVRPLLSAAAEDRDAVVLFFVRGGSCALKKPPTWQVYLSGTGEIPLMKENPLRQTDPQACSVNPYYIGTLQYFKGGMFADRAPNVGFAVKPHDSEIHRRSRR
jgi:hypothetical protein